MNRTRRDIIRVIEAEDDFLVVSHEGPDGDALGSIVAMGWILETLGKRFHLYNPSGTPEHFAWLKSPAPVLKSLEELGGFEPRRVVVLDCGDPFRIGKELLKAVKLDTIINIDHHVGNPMFGALNWVDPNMAAVGEMVALLAEDLGIPLGGGLGEAIYLAVVSDTGNFSYGNTKPETMELAAKIMRAGLSTVDFNSNYQNQWNVERIRFWSDVLRDAELHMDDKVAIVQIPLALMERYGTGPEDCEGLVEFMRRVKTVRVAISMREESETMIKFSLRSQGADNVQQVALRFGGGGHRNAAGCKMAEPMDVAKTHILGAIREEMNL